MSDLLLPDSVHLTNDGYANMATVLLDVAKERISTNVVFQAVAVQLALTTGEGSTLQLAPTGPNQATPVTKSRGGIFSRI